jgi:hypothetical protein
MYGDEALMMVMRNGVSLPKQVVFSSFGNHYQGCQKSWYPAIILANGFRRPTQKNAKAYGFPEGAPFEIVQEAKKYQLI